MANVCRNIVTIEGSFEELKNFLIKENQMIKDTLKESYIERGWYHELAVCDWHVTISNPYNGLGLSVEDNMYFDETEEMLRYEVFSKWDYPEGFAAQLSSKYPNLTFDVVSSEVQQGIYKRVFAEGGKEKVIKSNIESYYHDNFEDFHSLFDRLDKAPLEDFPLFMHTLNRDSSIQGMHLLKDWFRKCMQDGEKRPLPEIKSLL